MTLTYCFKLALKDKLKLRQYLKKYPCKHTHECFAHTTELSCKVGSGHAHLHSADKLAVDVQGCSAVLQHPFAHHQNQVMPLPLNDQFSTTEASTAWQNLIERGFFTKIINWRRRGKKLKTHHHPHSNSYSHWDFHSVGLISCCCAVTELHLTPATLWSVSCQALLSMGFPRQEHWRWLHFLLQGGLPDPGIEPMSSASAGGFFTTESPGKPRLLWWWCK